MPVSRKLLDVAVELAVRDCIPRLYCVAARCSPRKPESGRLGVKGGALLKNGKVSLVIHGWKGCVYERRCCHSTCQRGLALYKQ